jgi:hypothetical protein
VLFPIGSSCIKRFNRDDLSTEVSVYEQLFKLIHHTKNNEFISLSRELFSRKLIGYLYDLGAFNTEYNNFHGWQDYQFILRMFNKQNKYSITPYQHRKIRAIMVASIKPFLEGLVQINPNSSEEESTRKLKVSLLGLSDSLHKDEEETPCGKLRVSLIKIDPYS